jgi:uncharacterized membrane protein
MINFAYVLYCLMVGFVVLTFTPFIWIVIAIVKGILKK